MASDAVLGTGESEGLVEGGFGPVAVVVVGRVG